jgi:hypothetical protein
MKLFKSIEHNNKSTEEEVLNKLDWLFNEWKISHLNNKEELIRFLFKIYFYKRTFRLYIPLLDYIFRIVLIIIFCILVFLPFYWSLLIINDGIIINNEETLWLYRNYRILISNVVYFLIPLYVLVRIYTYTRLLLRNEIQKNYSYSFTIWLLKFIWTLLFVPFTWFLWSLLWSLYNIIHLSIQDIVK